MILTDYYYKLLFDIRLQKVISKENETVCKLVLAIGNGSPLSILKESLKLYLKYKWG